MEQRRLFIAEKPSLARDVAAALGRPVSAAQGFLDAGSDRVTYCVGHLLEFEKPDEMRPDLARWSLDTLPFLPGEWVLRPRSLKDQSGRDVKKNGKVVLDPKVVAQLKVIRDLLAWCTCVVHTGDADREGQMIVDEVISHWGCRKPVMRLWLQELNPQGIQKAMSRMKDNEQYRGLSESAVARSRLDFVLGMNATRGYTRLWQEAGQDGMLNVGRVQTPTLWLVRNRELERESFKAVDHFGVKAAISHANGEFEAFWVPPKGAAFLDEEGRVVAESAAALVAGEIQGERAIVESVVTQRKIESQPLPYTLLELQKAANRLGLKPDETLEAAQWLYETAKVLSYPRTDCPYLPEEDHKRGRPVMEALRENFGATWAPPGEVDFAIKSPAWNDSKLGAHHGIVPTIGRSQAGGWSERHKLVYGLVATRYVAQFMAPYEYDATAAVLRARGHEIRATGRVTVVEGWRALYRSRGPKDELAILPPMALLDEVTILEAQVVRKRTEAPPLLDGASLLDAMKNAHKFVQDPTVKSKLKEVEGLGTEATRAAIIASLIRNGYIREVAKKTGKSRSSDYATTERGQLLLQVVSDDLSRPDLTAWMEGKLESIVQGHGDLVSFGAITERFVRRVVERIKDPAAKTKLPVGSSPAKACHVCSGTMSLRRAKATGEWFWGCRRYPDCRGTAKASPDDVKGREDAEAGQTTPAEVLGGRKGRQKGGKSKKARARH